MAIPATPVNYFVQQANRQVLLSWDIVVGATSYQIQQSLDGVTFTNYATVSVNSFLDITVVAGTLYYYQVAAVNGSGTSAFTAPQSVVPTPTAEMSLGQLRQLSQQKADMVTSNFISMPEWNNFINLAMYELYDLLVTADEEYYVATPAQFSSQANGSQTYLYPLPDGVTAFTNGINGTSTYIAPQFYKLKGVDLALNTSANAWVTINKFNFIDRNTFVYPNTASSIYGVFNLQYRLLGNSIEFIPTPSAGQKIRLWYIPRLPALLADTDITSIGISGWNEYIICRAAKYAMDKQQLDSTGLSQELLFITDRIQSTAVNRDMGQPDRISNMRRNGSFGDYGSGSGFNSPTGGW